MCFPSIKERAFVGYACVKDVRIPNAREAIEQKLLQLAMGSFLDTLLNTDGNEAAHFLEAIKLLKLANFSTNPEEFGMDVLGILENDPSLLLRFI